MPANRPDESKQLWRDAVEHLRSCQRPLRELIDRVGPCTLQPTPRSFVVLARTIVAQQLSTAAAETISSRLQQAARTKHWQPRHFLSLTPAALRRCGLSAAKVRSLRDLADKCLTGAVPLRQLPRLDDDAIRACLLEVQGIGPWSVDMYLMFSLGRPDVLPVGDLGLRAGVRDVFGLRDLPNPEELQGIAMPWRPYRSIATWYFWRSRGFVPQSKNGQTSRATVARRSRS